MYFAIFILGSGGSIVSYFSIFVDFVVILNSVNWLYVR